MDSYNFFTKVMKWFFYKKDIMALQLEWRGNTEGAPLINLGKGELGEGRVLGWKLVVVTFEAWILS